MDITANGSVQKHLACFNNSVFKDSHQDRLIVDNISITDQNTSSTLITVRIVEINSNIHKQKIHLALHYIAVVHRPTAPSLHKTSEQKRAF